MVTFSGKGVYGDIAIGKIFVFKRNQAKVRCVHIADVSAEQKRLQMAKNTAIEQLKAIYKKALKEVGEANAQLFESYMMLIEDEDYIGSISNIIETQHVNAEYAIAVTSGKFSEMLCSMDDVYMQSRAVDVKDISNHIISCLNGTHT